MSMPLGQCRASALNVLVLVIDGRIEAQLVDYIAALGGASGNADHAAAFDLCNLSNYGAHCSGRSRHNYCLALLRLANIEQAEVSGKTRHAEKSNVTAH